MQRHPVLRNVGALVLGALCVLAFAPFAMPLLAIACAAALFSMWLAAPRARDAAQSGYAFGLGLFGAGASWVYIALQTFGGMPVAVAVLATFAFVAWLALWPALAGYAAVRVTMAGTPARAAAIAGAWAITEWLRGIVFTGFPWLALGSSQLPGSTLAGFAPLGGTTMVTLGVAATAALAALAIDAIARAAPRRALGAAAGIVVLFVAGAAAWRTPWTEPSGRPLAASLIQGNVALREKFDPAFRDRNFDLYAFMAEQSRGRLIVFPESAMPVFAHDVPEAIFERIGRAADARDGDALIGLFTLSPPASDGDEPGIHNSVITVGANRSQIYRKHHLVPFGETIPLKPVLGFIINDILSIPLADQTPGPANAPPLDVAGEKVAVDICYEDAYGAELRHGAREATLLVNVTNDAWYGHSIAAWQHNQIAAMRALESGRPLLRATNTGITAAFGADGREIASLPWYTRGILEVRIEGRTGTTPYLRFGDALPLAFAAVLFAAGWMARRRDGGASRRTR
ncbi:MAG TPA: apolipoprotein N-acyltransferase [Casimicrobiaceae bacterium]|nr:apolipoprotein N-acyltransferase [Casimicrobiaceae bacterium]